MIRISACFNVPIDIIEPCGFPFSLKALKRSAMDYADLAEIHHHNSWGTFQDARATRRLVLMSTKASTSIWDFEFSKGDTLVMGRESAGVPSDVSAACAAAVRIPMQSNTRSLNVAVSAGIALAEALRQNRGQA